MGSCLQFADSACRGNKDFLLKAVQLNSLCLEYASCRDREILLAGVKNNPLCLQFARPLCFLSSEDREIMLEAVSNHPSYLKVAGGSWTKDIQFMRLAVENN